MAAPTPLQDHDQVDMHQGDTRRLRFSITGIADITTVSSAEWAMYPQYSDAAAVTKTTASGITSDATDDVLIVALAKADTAALDPGTYVDELRVVHASGDEEVVARGPILIRDRRVGE